MRKVKTVKLFLTLCLIFTIMISESVFVQAGNDLALQGYEKSTSIKGQQTYKGTNYGSQHTFYNLDITNFYLPDTYLECGVDWYTFEGKKYRFYNRYDSFVRWVKEQNDKGLTVNVQFMISYEETDHDGNGDLTGRRLLIDEAARVKGAALYYAPAASGEGRQIMRAFWSWIMYKLDAYHAHVDNFILGNEVNMPNSWHYSGNVGTRATVEKYATSFYDMRQIVRQYTSTSRCSICMDHSWTHDDEGRGIPAKTFISIFDECLANLNGGKKVDDWCLSMHLYPAILFEPAIWTDAPGFPGNLNERSENAKFVDGRNLSYVTNYIKKTYGDNHRIMLTEQGFSIYRGEEVQAASLAYSYYAAKYDPMVDSFILNLEETPGGGSKLDFRIDGRLAGDIYQKIDDPSQQEYIANRLLPVIGVSSWSDIIPNFGQEIQRKKYVGSGYSDGKTIYDGVDYSAVFDMDYYAKANPDVSSAWGKNVLSHFVQFGMDEGRQGNEEFNVKFYKGNYPDLAAAYGDDWKAYYLHYMNEGKAEGRIADRDISTPKERPALILDPCDDRPTGSLVMYRLYNPNSGEHFYTNNAEEVKMLYDLGWNYEDVAWYAPEDSENPVYRLYNPNAGDHHYTTNGAERDMLVSVGWQYEGIGWYSDDADGQALYRVYNPNATGAGSHHYTVRNEERDMLVSIGWNDEGIGWYGMK